jgi:diguanylate cyclase
VAKMADEGRESIKKLTSEIADYQTRLMASERRALIDPLTGLTNRRGFEQQLEQRVQSGQPFSLLVADLNGFKATNDRYGHIVGDEILKRFATELKAQFLSEDTVARWGGDEFVGIVAGSAREGAARADRVRHWVLGEYELTLDDQTIVVVVDAALGTMAWNGAESGLELFARADKEMYRVKQASRELV